MLRNLNAILKFSLKMHLENLGQSYSVIFIDRKKLKVELEVLYSNEKYQNLHHVYDLVKSFEYDGV